jgi:hypothetical protein
MTPRGALRTVALVSGCAALSAGTDTPAFRVVAFFSAKQDQAHISFVHERFKIA